MSIQKHKNRALRDASKTSNSAPTKPPPLPEGMSPRLAAALLDEDTASSLGGASAALAARLGAKPTDTAAAPAKTGSTADAKPATGSAGTDMRLQTLGAISPARLGSIQVVLPGTPRLLRLMIRAHSVLVGVATATDSDREPYEFALPHALEQCALFYFPQNVAALMSGSALQLSGEAPVIGEDGAAHPDGDFYIMDGRGVFMWLSSKTGEWYAWKDGPALKPREVFTRIAHWIKSPSVAET